MSKAQTLLTLEHPAVNALLAYHQADEDGIMVLVSRQAIHEVVDLLTQLSTQKAEMVKKVMEERTKIAQISATKISRGWVVAQFDDLLDKLNTK